MEMPTDRLGLEPTCHETKVFLIGSQLRNL